MKKSSAVKTASHQTAKHSGQVSYKAEINSEGPLRHSTVASETTNRVDSFEEMTKEIALSMKVPHDPVADGPKLSAFSYNMCRSTSEENAACLNKSKLKQNGSAHESSIRKVKPTETTRNMVTKGKAPAQMRRVSLAAGNIRTSVTMSADQAKSSATGGRRNNESMPLSRWQQSMKRRTSQGLDTFKPKTGVTPNERTVKTDTKSNLYSCNSPVNCSLITEKGMNNGNNNHIRADDMVTAENKRINLKHRNGKCPLVKTSHSDSNITSKLEYSTLEDGHHFQNKNVTNEKTVSQLSRPVVETDLVIHENGMGSSRSPGRSRVSSGSRTSSVSQRSIVSTSTTSTGSLAERIIESRVLINSLDSNFSLPVNVEPSSLSVYSEESVESTKFIVYSKRTGVAVSDSSLNLNNKWRSHDVHGAQGGSVSLSEVRKHIPDMAPKDGENSVPIRHIYKRKQRRMVLEA